MLLLFRSGNCGPRRWRQGGVYSKGHFSKASGHGTVKKSIHVAGVFEWKEPRLTDKKQLKDGALASQCISEVVHEGETVKVKLDLSKQNGKEYRVEFRVEVVKEEQRSGS